MIVAYCGRLSMSMSFAEFRFTFVFFGQTHLCRDQEVMHFDDIRL